MSRRNAGNTDDEGKCPLGRAEDEGVWSPSALASPSIRRRVAGETEHVAYRR